MCKVLVVSDEPVVSKTVRKILEHGGHRVTTTLRVPRETPELMNQPFDLVLTDIDRPDTDGLEVIARAHAEFLDSRIIAISGRGALPEEDFLAMARFMGAERVLYKPFRAEVLLEAVKGKEQPSKGCGCAPQ